MIYLELFYVFFLIGAFTFGGGYAMIPLIENEVVSRGWIDVETFYDMVAISESTPGPIAVNMATFVGKMRGGILGSIVSTFGVILPSFIIILLIASILTHIIKNKYVQAILNGFKGIVVGLILATGITFLYSSLSISFKEFFIDYIALIIFAIIIIIGLLYKKIFKKKISPYLVLIISGSLGILLYYINSLF